MNRAATVLVFALLCGLGVTPCAQAAQPRAFWHFAWDPHPQAPDVGYFLLRVCVSLRCWVTRIDGGTDTTARNVYLDPLVVGDGTAVLQACLADGRCSGDSNTVVLDRTAPQPPTAVEYGFNQR